MPTTATTNSGNTMPVAPRPAPPPPAPRPAPSPTSPPGVQGVEPEAVHRLHPGAQQAAVFYSDMLRELDEANAMIAELQRTIERERTYRIHLQSHLHRIGQQVMSALNNDAKR